VVHVVSTFWGINWGSITDLFKTVGGDIKDFVKAMVSDAIDFALLGVHLITDTLKDAIDLAGRVFDAFKNAIYAITDGIRGLAWSLWTDAKNYADLAIRTAIAGLNFVAAPLYDLVKLASGWINEAFTMAKNWTSEFIYWPLYNLIQGVVSTVWSSFYSAVKSWVEAAFNIWMAPFHWVIDPIKQLWSWFVNIARLTVEIAWKAKDFLLFVIAHPLDWWRIMLNDLTRKAPHWVLDNIARAADAHGSLIEDWAVKALG
jgi:hypothetical protein